MVTYRDRLAKALINVPDSDIDAITSVLSEARSAGVRVWLIGTVEALQPLTTLLQISCGAQTSLDLPLEQ